MGKLGHNRPHRWTRCADGGLESLMWLEEAVQSCTDELIPAHLRMRRKRRMCLHRPSLTRNCIGDMVRHFPRNEHEGG